MDLVAGENVDVHNEEFVWYEEENLHHEKEVSSKKEKYAHEVLNEEDEGADDAGRNGVRADDGDTGITLEEDNTLTKKKKRSRNAKPETWDVNINKKKRCQGEAKSGLKNVNGKWVRTERPARSRGIMCTNLN